MKLNHQYYVYILSNMKNGTFYIGMTNDLERRMFEHKNKLVKGFTKQYGLNKLVYFEQFQYVNDAIKREKQLKNWNRQWKIYLIQEDNIEWNDLSYHCLIKWILNQVQDDKNYYRVKTNSVSVDIFASTA